MRRRGRGREGGGTERGGAWGTAAWRTPRGVSRERAAEDGFEAGERGAERRSLRGCGAPYRYPPCAPAAERSAALAARRVASCQGGGRAEVDGAAALCPEQGVPVSALRP